MDNMGDGMNEYESEAEISKIDDCSTILLLDLMEWNEDNSLN